tara:strand:+ start:38133 stop:38840 length:708 start_codon:yes stop_codon:yes gene_type:complete
MLNQHTDSEQDIDMSPLLLLLFAAFGSMVAVFDPFSGNDDTDMPEDDSMRIGDEDQFVDSNGTTLSEFAAELEAESLNDGLSDSESVSGSDDDDILNGSSGADIIEGGDGDDVLSGSEAGSADDDMPDQLFGEDGDDLLYLGSEDTGTGGEGADTFIATADAQGNVTIEDYNVEHDALVVETDDENTFVTHQTVSEGSLKVSLSTGLTITLPGVDHPLNDDVISFVLTNPLRDGG